jgi:hypothetical protein
MNGPTRRFRERSADRLNKIANLLEAWLDDFAESEDVHDVEAHNVLGREEYPFDQSLDDLLSEHDAAQSRARRARGVPAHGDRVRGRLPP